MLYSEGGRETMFRNLSLNLRPKVEERLEPHKTTEEEVLEGLDRVEYPRLEMPKGLEGEIFEEEVEEESS